MRALVKILISWLLVVAGLVAVVKFPEIKLQVWACVGALVVLVWITPRRRGPAQSSDVPLNVKEAATTPSPRAASLDDDSEAPQESGRDEYDSAVESAQWLRERNQSTVATASLSSPDRKLIPCAACDNAISPMSVSCPKCGHPQEVSDSPGAIGQEASKASRAVQHAGDAGAAKEVGLIAVLAAVLFGAIFVVDAVVGGRRSQGIEMPDQKPVADDPAACMGQGWALVQTHRALARDMEKAAKDLDSIGSTDQAAIYRRKAESFRREAVAAIDCRGRLKASWVLRVNGRNELFCDACRKRVIMADYPGWKKLRR